VNVLVLVLVGGLTGATTVLFGFGGGFVTVPVIVWADAAAGTGAATLAVATSSLVMVVNAAVATVAAPRALLSRLRGGSALLALLACGGLVGAVAAARVPAPVITWGFVLYLAATAVDVLVRPGFLRPVRLAPPAADRAAIPAALGAPIGAVAAFLGVGGSVMTVPLLRRSGLLMTEATTLANPLTLALSLPACATFLVSHDELAGADAALFPVGSLDVGAAALLLLGAIPVVTALRRRPPRVPDRAHAWSYLSLLVVVLVGMVTAAVARSR
jgi:uncharacterized protein